MISWHSCLRKEINTSLIMLQQELCRNVRLVQFVYSILFFPWVCSPVHAQQWFRGTWDLSFFASLPSPIYSPLSLHCPFCYPRWVFRLRVESYWLMSFCKWIVTTFRSEIESRGFIVCLIYSCFWLLLSKWTLEILVNYMMWIKDCHPAEGSVSLKEYLLC